MWYGDSAVAAALVPLAWLFGLFVALRRQAYRSGVLAPRRCGVPVVVVGNITAGGAGKTPLVGWLAERLAADGRKVGILSRGYGGLATGEPRFVTRDSDAREVGDEAVLLARRFPARVCVCADRLAGARHLVAEAGVDTIVCDDGLQHYRLARHLEIAVVDGARGLGNGRLLPAGPLRETAGRLDEVDFVFVNGAGRFAGGRRFDLVGSRLRRLGGTEQRNLADFRGRQVWAVAGIGNPERFAAALRAAGVEPRVVDVPDHGVVDLAALRDLHAWPILMTEKDAVKYASDRIADAWYLPVEVAMPPADEATLMESLRELYV
jgi:tetraacyldisaccharide 4'-kinase